MIPETRSATDRIFGHFGLFFVLYRGQEIIVLWKSWWALFSCYDRFEIRSFELLT